MANLFKSGFYMKNGFVLVFSMMFMFLAGHVSGQIQISFTATPPTCNGYTDGVITALPVGGQSPYGYYWQNGQGGQTLLGVGAGTYGVTVTDALGETATASYTLSQPAPVVATISPSGFPCGGMAGTLNASLSSPNAVVSYLWDNGATTQSIQVSASGNYFATLTDAIGCADVADFFLPPGGVSSITVFPQYNIAKPLCNGQSNGSATVVNVWGQNPPFTYKWSNGVSNAPLTNVPSGSYTLTFTDAQGCTMADTVVVPVQPAVIVDLVVGNINCYKYEGSGMVNALASGGVSPYTYAWTPNIGPSSFVQNVHSGTYTVTVTDANGCTLSATNTVHIADSIKVTFSNIIPSCGGNTGSATITATGGTPPYTYNWSNQYYGSTVTGLAPGTYYVCTMDAMNCTKDTTITIPGTSALNVQLLLTKALCPGVNNGQVTAVVTPPGAYNYSWNIYPGLNVGMLNDVPANTTVTVTVTDPNTGCQGTATGYIGTHHAITVDVTDVDVNCLGGNNGSATAVPANGTAPYSYVWTSAGSVIDTTASINNLAVGIYQVS
ncbi:MAG: hypothetical protein IT269_12605, partial [Saprospiraceae bacterium]|nr:hypothetical protein [Saprospiraceae bacterium]